jgi:hypothetical protein
MTAGSIPFLEHSASLNNLPPLKEFITYQNMVPDLAPAF